MRQLVVFYLAIAAIVAGAVAGAVFLDGKPLAAVEIPLALALCAMLSLYRSVIAPVRALNTGINLLQAQDFGSRLARVGQPDADNIGATFNRMIDLLREERLRVMEQNRLLDLIIASSPMGVVIMDFDGRVADANPAALRLLGCRDIKGKRLIDADSELAKAAGAMKPDASATFRLGDTHIYRCSTPIYLDRGFRRYFVLIESLTEEVRKAERQAYAKVIRTIAHEVNNTMAGVTPVLDIMEMEAPSAELRPLLHSCRERWESLGSFITAYADVVKLPPPHPVRSDLCRLLRSLHPFLESLGCNRDVAVRLEGADGEMPMELDPVLMEQAIVNIVKNGVESIGHGGAVAMTLDRQGATLTITDNGHGISPEAASSLFTPFFTTKDGGQGIGLMTVAEILNGHGFPFRLHTSETDRLTRFTIKLTPRWPAT